MDTKRGNITIICMLICSAINSQSALQKQNLDTVSYRKTLNEVEVKFLYSYYEQDGDNSPVLGGMGTEYLTDHVGKISVSIPIRNSIISFSAGIDHYTSASTDNINPASISSASVVDDRVYFNGSFSRDKEKWSYGFHGGFSTEWDVTSFSGGFNLAKTFNNDNSQLNFDFQHFSDNWELIFPVEIRQQFPLDSTDWRHVFDWSLVYSQVLSNKVQASISSGLTLQKGYLATPFHRVYFKDALFPKPENLPRQRIKIPIGLHLNYFVTDYLVAKCYYRFYFDDFGIKAHTTSLELPIKANHFLAISPFYRFHTQTASRYFKKIDTHLLSERFYTSDYDLSAFQSHKVGMGIRYAPIKGVLHSKNKEKYKGGVFWKKLEGRLAWYWRSDGLVASIFSIASTFTLNP